MQRCVRTLVLDIDICALLKEKFRDLSVALMCRSVKSRPTMKITKLVYRNTLFDQPFDKR